MAIFKAAVVQLSISDLSNKSWPEVEKKLIFLFSQGVESGADLVVFPALTGLLFSPESRKSLEYGFDHKTVQLVSRLSGFWTKEWLDFFTSLARNYRVLVVPGSSLEPTKDGMLHRAYLIGENGEELLVQDQTHFTLSQQGIKFQPGDSLEIAETSVGKIGLILSEDVWLPEIGRILALEGADLLINLQAVRNFYDYRRQLAGSWQVAQSNLVYVIESCLVGRGIGLSYQGLSAIFASRSVQPNAGILVHIDPLFTKLEEIDLGYMISPQKEKEGVLIRNLDLDLLAKHRQERSMGRPPYLTELSQVYTDQVAVNRTLGGEER
ncbi:MAG: carbon-nitrogen hydrolase family protein [Firmicutes bacterium]|nr:carbon-nitrogen hydrolase family protein [Bacillota bacterium]